MARKPIRLQAAGALQPRDRIWAGIRALKEFTRDDLFSWCAKHAPKGSSQRCIDERTIATNVKNLAAGGYLDVVAVASDRYAKKTYRLVRDVGAHAPRVTSGGREVTLGEGSAQLWNSMRRLKRFDHRDLVAASAAEISASTARNYCLHLRYAGYLVLETPAKNSTPARYRFVRDTGPRAPVVQHSESGKSVYDPNLGRVVWPTKASS